MKRSVFAKLTALIAVLALACSLMACKPEAQEGTKSITLVIDLSYVTEEIVPSEGIMGYTDQKKVFELETESKYLEDVLDELVADKKLEVSGTKSAATGLMITNIDNVSADYMTDGRWISVYCNDMENVDSTSEWAQSYDYGEAKLWTANWGVTSLPVKDGLVYALVVVAA